MAFNPITAVVLFTAAVQETLTRRSGRAADAASLLKGVPNSYQSCFDAVAAETFELTAGGGDDGCDLIVQRDELLADPRGARGGRICVVVHPAVGF